MNFVTHSARGLQLSVVFTLIALCACNSEKKLNKDFAYFQRGLDSAQVQYQDPILKVDDLLSIQVNSKTTNQEQVAVFNIPVLQPAAGANVPQGYLIDGEGNIEMPVIGAVKAAGLTKIQLQKVLAHKLEFYVKEPIVQVKLQQFYINVLGEVKQPGLHNFATDRVTVLDAIGSAQDLNDYGRREDVMVIREDSGKRKFFRVDLRSGDLFNSPAYQLHSNDVVYVGPNKTKLYEVNMNPRKQKNTQLFFVVISILTSLGTLYINSRR